MSDCFNLKVYDLFSFDLDNTLCEYNIESYCTLYYQYIINYLVNNKKYENLTPGLHSTDISFISKGLFIDHANGNLLKFDKNGVILRASHGTNMLNEETIVETYGSNRSIVQFTERLNLPLELLSKRCLKKLTPIVDYSNAALSLAYAKAVDGGEASGKTFLQISQDVREAVNSLYVSGSSWCGQFAKNLSYLTYKQDRAVVNWLKHLRKFGHIALVTSSNKFPAQLVAARALGNNWKTLFDFIVYSSCKPFFFTKNKRFLPANVHDHLENDFILKGEYTRGSYDQIKIALENKLGRKPRMLHFGDSVLNDLVAAPEAVAIIQESAAENFIPLFRSVNKAYITSSQWGSLFFENQVPTWYGNLIMNCKFCAPSLSYLSRSTHTYDHTPFWYRYKHLQQPI